MPSRKERMLPAQLDFYTLKLLYLQVCNATDGTREDRHCLDKAHLEISKILGVEFKLGDKEVKFNREKELKKIGVDQYEFSHAAVIGFKIALAQYLTGQSHPKLLKADVAARLEIMKISVCFSKKFVEALKKDAKLEDTKPEDVILEEMFDDAPEEKQVEPPQEDGAKEKAEVATPEQGQPISAGK